MDKYIGGIQFLLAFIISWFAVHKVVVDIAKEKTKQVIAQAKENSLGREALILLKAEVQELRNASKDSLQKIGAIENVIKQMEWMIELIERRMLKEIPNK